MVKIQLTHKAILNILSHQKRKFLSIYHYNIDKAEASGGFHKWPGICGAPCLRLLALWLRADAEKINHKLKIFMQGITGIYRH